MKLDLIRDSGFNNVNGTDNSFNICRQITEVEKLSAEDVSNLTCEKKFNLKLNILQTALGEDLGCFSDEEKKMVNKSARS